MSSFVSWVVPFSRRKLALEGIPAVAFLVAATMASWLTWSRPLIAADVPDHIPTPDPVAERSAMSVVDGGVVNLFASDPQIAKPVQMNFDCQGNLWVATSQTYPQVEPGKPANDKIVVLRDTTGDGVADQSTVFADGLLIPTAVMPDGPNAAYVADSTQLLYLVDTDHDGRADQREVVLSGFGTEDTHHLLHTLRWGPDGCLYFNQSIYIHSHLDTPDGTRHLDGGGIWRFHPPTRRLDVMCKGFINPWGHIFDSNGESFVTDGAFFEGINYTFPDAVFVTSPGAVRWMSGLNPGSPKHCGLEIVSGNHVPPSWRGSLITNDFRSHRVCRFEIKPSQAGFLSRQQPEPITSTHVGFRPIDARMGPDGAIYIADWYNPIIQHGEVDFRDPRRDRKHGRIWRLSFPERPLDHWPPIGPVNARELGGMIELLEHDSLAVRQFARRELWAAAGLAVGSGSVPPAKPAASAGDHVRQAIDAWAAQSPSTRNLESLWFGEAVGAADPAIIQRTIDQFGSVADDQARTTLRSIWRSRRLLDHQPDLAPTIESFVLSCCTHDNPDVRCEAVVAAGQMSSQAALSAVIGASELATDANLDFAIWQSLRHLASESRIRSLPAETQPSTLATVVQAVSAPWATQAAIDQFIDLEQMGTADRRLLAAVIQTGSAKQLGTITRALLSQRPSESFVWAMNELIARTTSDKTVPANVDVAFRDALQSSIDDADAVRTLATAAAIWNVTPAADAVISVIEKASPEDQPELIRLVGGLASQRVNQSLVQWSKSESSTVAVSALTALSRKKPWAAAAGIAGQLRSPTPQPAIDAIGDLLSRKGFAAAILKQFRDKSLPPEVAKVVLRRAQAASASQPMLDAIRTAGGLSDTSWKLTPEWSQQLIDASRSTASARRGEAIYRRGELQCIACHAIGGGSGGPNGGEVGPNLISIGGSAQPDYIIESLIEPSAKLKEGYSTRQVLTFDGEVISGIAIGEDDDSLRLRLADGKQVTVLKDDIELEKPGKSLMPAGLVDGLTQDELADLVAFLAALGRLPEWSVSTEPIVRSFETMNYTKEANRRLNRTSVDAAAGDDPVMTWRTMTARVSGEIPLEELDRFQQHKSTPPTSFIRFVLSMPEPGTAKIQFPIEGIEAWVDGRPTPVWELESLELDAGDHPIVLAIDRTQVSPHWTIRTP